MQSHRTVVYNDTESVKGMVYVASMLGEKSLKVTADLGSHPEESCRSQWCSASRGSEILVDIGKYTPTYSMS